MTDYAPGGIITTPVGRHRRTPTPGHVPTDRTQAAHHHSLRGAPHVICPRCVPEDYAIAGAKHRSDR